MRPSWDTHSQGLMRVCHHFTPLAILSLHLRLFSPLMQRWWNLTYVFSRSHTQWCKRVKTRRARTVSRGIKSSNLRTPRGDLLLCLGWKFNVWVAACGRDVTVSTPAAFPWEVKGQLTFTSTHTWPHFLHLPAAPPRNAYSVISLNLCRTGFILVSRCTSLF